MFSIHKKKENGFDKIILKDDGSGTFAEIIPSCSAILHNFSVVKNEKNFNVIESYKSAEDFKQHVTSKGFLGTKLSPFVCRINKGTYNFEDRNYHIEKYYDKNNALHGMLYDKSFAVIAELANADSASISMKYEYRSEDNGYPFNYDCIVTYQLEINNRLNIFTEVVNRDEKQIPIQDGWHPYFTLGDTIDNLILQFQSNEMVEFDEELIPTGKLIPYKEFYKQRKLGTTFFDNCFTINFSEGQPICLLQNEKENIQIEIHTDETYPYLQFYTPSHRKSIAIENISGAPDAFNNEMGVIILSPGGSFNFATSYKITLLP